MKRMKPEREDHLTIKNADKPAVEVATALIPPLEHSPDGSDDMLLYVEKTRSNRLQQVENGKIYTIRLGVHNRSADVGAFSRDTIAGCFIPTVISKRHRITAFFTQRENFPAVFMDDIILKANAPVKLEYIKGSAALECNCTKGKIWLEDDATALEERIMIATGKLDASLPECYTYTYDFITFQVRIAEEYNYYVQKQVRVLGGVNDEGQWSDSVIAKVGDNLEFRVTFANSDSFASEIVITDKLPECLKFIEGEVCTYATDGTGTKALEEDKFVSTGLIIKGCAPETEVVFCYTVEVIDCPLPNDIDRAWNWSIIRVGANTLEDYAEVVIQ